MANVLEFAGVVKRFGSFTALDGLDLTVHEGKSMASSGQTVLARRRPCAWHWGCCEATRVRSLFWGLIRGVTPPRSTGAWPTFPVMFRCGRTSPEVRSLTCSVACRGSRQGTP